MTEPKPTLSQNQLRDAARGELLSAITETAKQVRKLDTDMRISRLKTLAETYALVVHHT